MATARRIELTAEEEQTLRMWTRAGTTEQRLSRRAKVILCCAQGLPIRAVGEQCGLSQISVFKWKRRFHLKTLIWLSPHCSPTALMGSPCAQQRMTFARRESLCSVVPARVHMRRVCSSSAVSSIRRAVAMNSLLRCTECDHLMGLLYYDTLEEYNTREVRLQG